MRSAHRLFFALWPSPALRRKLTDESAALVLSSGGKPTPGANLHVTVVFVGEQPAQRLDDILAAGAAVSAPAFTLTFDRAESWSRSKVLVLPATHTPSELAKLEERLHVSLLERQIELRRDAYRPHVTLARKLPRTWPARPIEPFQWHAQEFVLAESVSEEGGPRYEVRARWPLA
ncbi:MAG TPA: RNA 2',3'-cyclic phosphodiesterase [Povalibacter sp.]|nr:RNA 2',3'-cyclic phosphodiesterase [Povalibacter sp.]